MKEGWIDGVDPGDVIERGEIVYRAYNGKFGKIFRALVNGLITQELIRHSDNPTDRHPLPADRVLGRCEAYQDIINKVEEIILDMESLKLTERNPVTSEEEDFD